MSSTSPSTSPKLLPKSASTSPPKTPLDIRKRPSLATPPSDDSSIIDDLSFDYVFDNDGNYIRLSKGSSSKSNNSSPPTPQDNLPHPSPDAPIKLSPPQARRASLSRSESAYPVLVSTGSASLQAEASQSRSFQRVASGPLLSHKAKPFPRRVTTDDNDKHKLTARSSQHAADIQHEKENIIISDSEQGHEALHSSRSAQIRSTYLRSGPSSDSNHRQIMPGPNRAGRVMKPSASVGSALRYGEYPILESHGTAAPPGNDALVDTDTDLEDDLVHPIAPSSTPFPSSEPLPDIGSIEDVELAPLSVPPPSAPPFIATSRQRSYGAAPSSSAREPSFPPSALPTQSSTGVRPRRSASLSDALSLHDVGHSYHHQQQQHQQQLRDQYNRLRSGPSTNESASVAKRSTLEDKDRELRKHRREPEEVERRHAEQEEHYDMQYESHPQPPPSTHRVNNGHRRRDSDTLRSMPMSTNVGSPTVVDPSSRTGGLSPSGARLGRNSPPSGRVGRASPPGKVSPPGGRGRISPSSVKAGHISPPPVRTTGRLSPAPSSALASHKRSPTAPEAVLRDGPLPERAPSAKGWSNSDRDDDYGSHNERERDRDARRMQQQSLPEQQQPKNTFAAPRVSVPTSGSTAAQQRHIVVNKKAYARLDMIGKGGSSRVFRVLGSAGGLYAIKRVHLDKTDAETMSGYMNEIALLKRLAGNSRIIRLIDSEVKSGPGGSKGYLMLVMECGEVDLARLISERAHEPLNMVWVAYYWQQMLQAVQVIHDEKIVHSDLKPANFVIVRGQLKLIDFGIANAIANDTTNIQRDHQVGTVNYMSPEAIQLPEGMRRLKVGRPSDVWSLGCIIYQMIYGQPPFQHLSIYQKMSAIPNMAHIIEFPEYSIPVAPPPTASSSGTPPGNATPPKRLDHLKRKVRRDIIDCMKGCLCRSPKERATIPELLEQDWLAMKDSETPAVKDILAPDETVINPYYMRQLLQYGIKLGEAQNADMSPEALLREAERLVAELKSIQP